MSEPFSSIRAGSRWVFRSSLVLVVVTTAVMLALLTDLSLFRATPLLYTLILAGIVTGSGLMIRNRYYLPFLRNLRLRGKLLLAPLALLIHSAPAAVIYLYHDLSGQASLLLLSDLFTTFGAAFWFSCLAVITLPAMGSVLLLESESRGVHYGKMFDDRQGQPSGENQVCLPGSCEGTLSDNQMKGEMRRDPWKISIIASLILAFVFVALSLLTGIRLSAAVFFLPMAAILMLLFDVIIVEEQKQRLSALMSEADEKEESYTRQEAHPEAAEGFRSVLLVADHYPDLTGGRLDYLSLHAGRRPTSCRNY